MSCRRNGSGFTVTSSRPNASSGSPSPIPAGGSTLTSAGAVSAALAGGGTSSMYSTMTENLENGRDTIGATEDDFATGFFVGGLGVPSAVNTTEAAGSAATAGSAAAVSSAV